MKTKIVMLAAFALGILSASAQKKPDPQKMAQYQNEVMGEELELDEEQLAKVEEVNFKYSKKQAEVIGREGSMFSKIGDMKKIRKAKNAELEKILTKEQMEEFEDEIEPKMRKTMRKKMSEE